MQFSIKLLLVFLSGYYLHRNGTSDEDNVHELIRMWKSDSQCDDIIEFYLLRYVLRFSPTKHTGTLCFEITQRQHFFFLDERQHSRSTIAMAVSVCILLRV